MKYIRKIPYIISVVLVIWLSISYLEVIAQNAKANPSYSEANFFCLVADQYQK